MYVAGMVQTSQSCQCILQECFKHPNNIRGAYCRNTSNTPIICCRNGSNIPVYVCRSASNTPMISGVHIAGMLQTPQSCQGCMYIAGMVQTSQYCQCMLQECFKHPNNIRGAYCRKASNTPIMSGCMYVAGMLQTLQYLSVYVAGVLQTLQYLSVYVAGVLLVF